MSKLHVVVFACERLDTLRHVIASVRRVMPPRVVRPELWVDMPVPPPANPHGKKRKKNPLAHRDVVAYARQLERKRSSNWRAVIFERHLGVRASWLTALSIRRTQLLLEDDVVLLPGAYAWCRYAMRAMSTRPYILGASFSRQTTVASLTSRRRTINFSTPYTYPMVGSHGFLVTKHTHDEFMDYRSTRSGCELMINGLRTSMWYMELLRAGQTEERMWTQEMVAFAFHRNKVALYPPSTYPLALHCAVDHGVDKMSKSCRQDIGNITEARRAPANFSMQIRSIDWAAEPYDRYPKTKTPWKAPNRIHRYLICRPPPPPPSPPSPPPPPPPPPLPWGLGDTWQESLLRFWRRVVGRRVAVT
jgi:hypothetical protein